MPRYSRYRNGQLMSFMKKLQWKQTTRTSGRCKQPSMGAKTWNLQCVYGVNCMQANHLTSKELHCQEGLVRRKTLHCGRPRKGHSNTACPLCMVMMTFVFFPMYLLHLALDSNVMTNPLPHRVKPEIKQGQFWSDGRCCGVAPLVAKHHQEDGHAKHPDEHQMAEDTVRLNLLVQTAVGINGIVLKIIPVGDGARQTDLQHKGSGVVLRTSGQNLIILVVCILISSRHQDKPDRCKALIVAWAGHDGALCTQRR